MTRALSGQGTWGWEGLRSPGGTDLCNTASRQGFPTMMGEGNDQGRRLCAVGGLQGRGPLPSRSCSRSSGQRAEEGLEMLAGGLRGLTFRRTQDPECCTLGSSGAVYRRDWVALPCNDSVFIVADWSQSNGFTKTCNAFSCCFLKFMSLSAHFSLPKLGTIKGYSFWLSDFLLALKCNHTNQTKTPHNPFFSYPLNFEAFYW